MTYALNTRFIFQENHALRELYLSHNKFQEVGGEIFADGLGENAATKIVIFAYENKIVIFLKQNL